MHSDEFVRSSNQYNNILSLGAVGVDNANETRGWDRIVGHAAVRLSGRTYHYIPQINTRNGIQFLLDDGSQGLLSEAGRERKVDEATLLELHADLEANNHYFATFSAIGGMADRLLLEMDPDATPDEVNSIIPQLNRATVQFDVSAITIDRSSGNHFLRVAVKGMGRNSDIPSTSIMFEPIGYPLLFPRGETGWGEQYRTGRSPSGEQCFKITFTDYLASRMLMPERHPNYQGRELMPEDHEVDDSNWGRFGRQCTKLDTGESFFMPTNRFERFHRLGQIYLVDQMSRAIDFSLKFHRENQSLIFGGEPRDAGGVDDNSDDDVPQPDQVPQPVQPDPVRYGIVGDHIGRLQARGRGRSKKIL
jgi:hypothetical protein